MIYRKMIYAFIQYHIVASSIPTTSLHWISILSSLYPKIVCKYIKMISTILNYRQGQIVENKFWTAFQPPSWAQSICQTLASVCGRELVTVSGWCQSWGSRIRVENLQQPQQSSQLEKSTQKPSTLSEGSRFIVVVFLHLHYVTWTEFCTVRSLVMLDWLLPCSEAPKQYSFSKCEHFSHTTLPFCQKPTHV